MKTFFILFLAIAATPGFAVTLVIDAVSRSVKSQASGATEQTATLTTTGNFRETKQSNGGNQTATVAAQNTLLVNDDTFTFANQGDFSVIGQRTGVDFSPVTISSESLVNVTFTVPAETGGAGYWVSGLYSVVGEPTNGAPQVSWSLAPMISGPLGGGAAANALFSGSATSGSDSFQSVGTLQPGQYQLKFSASLGDGSPQFIGPGSTSSASFQSLNFVASPLNVAPIPEPSSVGLLSLASLLIFFSRRRASSRVA